MYFKTVGGVRRQQRLLVKTKHKMLNKYKMDHEKCAIDTR